MIPVYQKYEHVDGKQKGDCWRACIASILELDIDSLPDPNIVTDWPTLYSNTLEVLEKFGYSYTTYSIVNIKAGMIDSLDTDGYIVVVGISPRSTPEKKIFHSIVWKNGKVFDPHPSDQGLLDIHIFEILRKIK